MTSPVGEPGTGRNGGEGGDVVLSVRELSVEYSTGAGAFRAVDGVSFDLTAGAALGVVGESGSGKSTTALALLGLHRNTDARVTGRILLGGPDGVEVNGLDDEGVRRVRGGRIAMIFQDPMTALDPYYRIGDQIAEVYRVHSGADRRAAWTRAVEVLDRVGIPDAARRARARPHEFSGGMRQRALIAMALACEPEILVADEPTSALDVTVQAQILDLLDELRADTGMALLLVTHDLGVVSRSADEVLVMHRGEIVERGPVREVLRAPARPYTRALLDAVPRIDAPRDARPVPGEPLLTVAGVTREFRRPGRGLRRETTRAVDDVSLDVRRGETLGVVGESGSGKTTLVRMMVGLLPPTSGRIVFGGETITGLPDRRLRRIRRDMQMVFQDPASSLNPRRTVGDGIADPLRVRGVPDGEARRTARELMERVGLDPARHDRYPHEFSGGQCQRVGIARALALRPRLLVCDEAVSALDVSTQAQILDLLRDVQEEYGLTIVFVSHDLAVIRQVSDRVAVLRGGALVELADVEKLYASPTHEYTRSLLAAVPVLA
ncbi:ABC transporter ATP-binding protein [Actinoallomurus soli]|uniref:ABC transporter ATP-binding protein n=1 Tax=Actinoallomurus soli TaxID=2952535 RepID=UPI002092CCF8|nr:ABC transporter ATP-binding protein [Actinoallomurus soli]MCO5969642.1 ABC transporter ATP-binding protein [Actinoallomurus soli]